MNTPNIYTIETILNMIDFMEESNVPYMIKMQSLHFQMCSIASLADSATFKACTIISQNYTHAQLQIELIKLNLIGGNNNGK